MTALNTKLLFINTFFFQGKCKLKTTMHQFLLTIDSPMLQNVKIRYRSNIFFEPEKSFIVHCVLMIRTKHFL